jgi:hypothetical protein
VVIVLTAHQTPSQVETSLPSTGRERCAAAERGEDGDCGEGQSRQN